MSTQKRTGVSERAKANIQEYWKSEFYKNKNSFIENNYYRIDVPNCQVFLIGDVEGDFAMIYNWFIDKDFINSDLDWIADEHIYILQAGDQIDKYGTFHYDDKGIPRHNLRRQRSPNLVELVSDFDTVVFFDYLAFASKKAYGKERVFSVLGNHEYLNLHEKYHHAINLLQNKEDKKSDIELYSNLMSVKNPYSPLVQILYYKRPVILRFNNLVLSHAGINDEAVANYLEHFGLNKFNIDEYIQDVNGYKKYGTKTMENKFYDQVVKPLIWNRNYELNEKGSHISEDNIKNNIVVLGHNPFPQVVFCTRQNCKYADRYSEQTGDNYDTLKVIKIDTGLSSRLCKNKKSEIFIAKLIFTNGKIISHSIDYYGFKCAEGEYPRVEFAPANIISALANPYIK